MSYYYDIKDDLTNYPDTWIQIIIGGRNTGKTFSALRYCYEQGKKFVFVKRTDEDVKLITSGSGRIGQKQNMFGMDLSPFKAINRVVGCSVKAFSVYKGLGGFWICEPDEEGNEVPSGAPIGYILSLNSVTKFKGFDLSDCDYIIFDEFIPQPWERVNRKEGEQIMDLYKTVSRDREHRGLPALKLLCLANATKASNPLMNILEITDKVVHMELQEEATFHDKERGILVHRIIDNPEFMEQERKSFIYKAMGNTAWGSMALENKFGYDDFTNVKKMNLKNFKNLCSIHFKSNTYYIYYRDDGLYHMTKSKCNNSPEHFDLDLDNDVRRFYREMLSDLQEICMEGRFTFQSYSMYDLIANYKNIFKV